MDSKEKNKRFEDNNGNRTSLTIRRQRSLEDYDTSTRDSGFCSNDKESDLEFSPRRLRSFSRNNSSNSSASIDDGFSEILENGGECSTQAGISGMETPFRKCLFLTNKSPATPVKRPDLFSSPISSKKAKIISTEDSSNSEQSEVNILNNENTIMSAVRRSAADPDLIGDFSKSYSLPLVLGKHQDLKSVSPDTLAKLIRGEYNDIIAFFKVIDCRYPYEYEGGHILNAFNYYTQEQIMKEFVNNREVTINEKRNILVFHCEFSSKRGPDLYRYLRNMDRVKHSDSYPVLNWPEIYLLEGGYKNFFENYPELCEPASYKPMLEKGYEKDLALFRAQSKKSSNKKRK